MFRFQLVSLSGTKFDDEVYEVILPTLDGEIGVLSQHMPLVSVATTGAVSVRRNPRDTDREREYFAINGGVVDVADNVLRVLVDEADHAASINQAEAEKAYATARKMMEDAKSPMEINEAQAMMNRQSVKLHVADLHRRHKSR